MIEIWKVELRGKISGVEKKSNLSGWDGDETEAPVGFKKKETKVTKGKWKSSWRTDDTSDVRPRNNAPSVVISLFIARFVEGFEKRSMSNAQNSLRQTTQTLGNEEVFYSISFYLFIYLYVMYDYKPKDRCVTVIVGEILRKHHCFFFNFVVPRFSDRDLNATSIVICQESPRPFDLRNCSGIRAFLFRILRQKVSGRPNISTSTRLRDLQAQVGWTGPAQVRCSGPSRDRRTGSGSGSGSQTASLWAWLQVRGEPSGWGRKELDINCCYEVSGSPPYKFL